MKLLVTGSAGHLGEGLVRSLRDAGHEVRGLDLIGTPFTTHAGSITDRELVRRCVDGVEAVLHTATLHKPHVATHARQAFIDTNVSGTLELLEACVASGVGAFLFTSTTSTFGRALVPASGEPAAWITEEVMPAPKNIYGVTKCAAEDLCELFHRNEGLSCIILRTSRFFPEEDDNRDRRDAYEDANLKANEYLHRRVELEDAVAAHHQALVRARSIGFARYIISATTPFTRDDLVRLRTDAPGVVERLFPAFRTEYDRRGWKMFPGLDRVYVNEKARTELDWQPRFDFGRVLELLRADRAVRSELATTVGSKSYHDRSFTDGPYPVE